jgi:hypothetical protein
VIWENYALSKMCKSQNINKLTIITPYNKLNINTMIKNFELATKPLKDGNSAKKMLERFYVQNRLENYLKTLECPDDKPDDVNSNYKIYVMAQVMEYIDGFFTLPQLYCIFNASISDLGGWKYDYSTMEEFKPFLLKYISEDAEYENDLVDIENFKMNVLKLNPIIFTVLNDILYTAGLFDNDYWEGYKYPEISDDEKECSDELQELIRTHDALEKVGAICKNIYRIDDRVSALTREGFEVKPCWVGSGGVNSSFYMYKTKEIRVQIAASKFKGNGNNKSKSALCAIIPYPKFLHKNCIRV